MEPPTRIEEPQAAAARRAAAPAEVVWGERTARLAYQFGSVRTIEVTYRLRKDGGSWQVTEVLCPSHDARA